MFLKIKHRIKKRKKHGETNKKKYIYIYKHCQQNEKMVKSYKQMNK